MDLPGGQEHAPPTSLGVRSLGTSSASLCNDTFVRFPENSFDVCVLNVNSDFTLNGIFLHYMAIVYPPSPPSPKLEAHNCFELF